MYLCGEDAALTSPCQQKAQIFAQESQLRRRCWPAAQQEAILPTARPPRELTYIALKFHARQPCELTYVALKSEARRHLTHDNRIEILMGNAEAGIDHLST